MRDGTLYDDDILAWSEQQAEALRDLARKRRDLPNVLDLENIAEEIESVGRSELAGVKSHIRQILRHLIKLACEPHSPAVPHWCAEIVGFRAELADRYAPSMGQRIDMDELWGRAVRQSALELGTDEGIPASCPFSLADLLDEALSLEEAAARIARPAT